MTQHPFDAKALLVKRAHIFKDCLVYLDSGAGELLATSVSLGWLLNDLGVIHVCALETASRRYSCALPLCSPALTKVGVIVLASTLPEQRKCVCAHEDLTKPTPKHPVANSPS